MRRSVGMKEVGVRVRPRGAERGTGRGRVRGGGGGRVFRAVGQTDAGVFGGGEESGRMQKL